MATKKVAGRVRQHPPAVMFPQSHEAPESHAVKVPHATANPRATASRIPSGARAIPLSRGLVAIVDENDFEMVSRFRWHACFGGRVAYAKATLAHGGTWASPRMHRMIMLPDPTEYVDHINGDGLDNRRCNLRVCTAAENAYNHRLQHNNQSGYRGVCWNRRDRVWAAQISSAGRYTYLGGYDTAEHAACAYDAAARNLHGEFARLNFPEATS